MIINTGGRTDTVQYYTKWLLRRFEEGYVYSRNPLFPNKVTRYDPVLLTEKYTIQSHMETFERMAKELAPFVDRCIFSFIAMPISVRKRLLKIIRSTIQSHRCFWVI